MQMNRGIQEQGDSGNAIRNIYMDTNYTFSKDRFHPLLPKQNQVAMSQRKLVD